MINVTKAYLPDKNKLFDYIDKIYDSAWLTNNGQFCRELERRLKEYFGVRNLILVSNGTLALQVAYKALGIKGSAVTTPFSFVATSSSLAWEGIRPVFADIDPNTWNIAPANIVQSIQNDTSAIVPVHVFGNPCEVEEIQKIADTNGLKVIYDGAHTFGVKYKGESILNWGDITTLSFHATKLFHTIEGGAIITSDDELAKKIRLLINFGISGPKTIECVGINCKMNEFQAAMGLCVLDEIEEIQFGRKLLWDKYRESLEGQPFVYQEWNCNGSQNHHYYPLILESEDKLNAVYSILLANQVAPRRYFYPSLDSLEFVVKSSEMTISADIAKRILCLPLYPGLSREEQNKIIALLKS